MVKPISLCLLLASTAVLSLSFGGQAPKDIVTKNYDVKDLAGRKILWRGMVGEKETKVDDIDHIIRLLIKDVDPKGWRGERFSIVDVNGTALEIRTTKTNHEQIVSYLAALRRLIDVEVVVEAGVYAVDRAYYEKEFALRFAKNHSRPLGLGVEEEEKLRKASRSEKANKVRLSDGGRGQVFSLQRAVMYEWLPPLSKCKTDEVALVGVRFDMEARVSADRRFVRVNLTQRGAELFETRKVVTTNAEGEEVILDIPDVQKSSTTNSITVGDGVVVVVPPAVPLPGFDAKGPVPLLFVRPYIWIGEEEAARKKQK